MKIQIQDFLLIFPIPIEKFEQVVQVYARMVDQSKVFLVVEFRWMSPVLVLANLG